MLVKIFKILGFGCRFSFQPFDRLVPLRQRHIYVTYHYIRWGPLVRYMRLDERFLFKGS